ncbi:MAG: hypothetical protein JSS50_01770 [Proteobacteria bacterium]|nr:hypothetical protein [Pseudomonadota bacterium]
MILSHRGTIGFEAGKSGIYLYCIMLLCLPVLGTYSILANANPEAMASAILGTFILAAFIDWIVLAILSIIGVSLGTLLFATVLFSSHQGYVPHYYAISIQTMALLIAITVKYSQYRDERLAHNLATSSTEWTKGQYRAVSEEIDLAKSVMESSRHMAAEKVSFQGYEVPVKQDERVLIMDEAGCNNAYQALTEGSKLLKRQFTSNIDDAAVQYRGENSEDVVHALYNAAVALIPSYSDRIATVEFIRSKVGLQYDGPQEQLQSAFEHILDYCLRHKQHGTKVKVWVQSELIQVRFANKASKKDDNTQAPPEDYALSAARVILEAIGSDLEYA